ncbi:hypothetical protein [Streptomyces sp. NPDC002573]
MLTSSATTAARSGVAPSTANSNRKGRLAAVGGYTLPWWWTAP